MRIRLDLAYNGGGFHGFAPQPGLRTVGGELSSALSTVLRREVPLVVAGRTDAGVHASGQVVHFDLLPGEQASALLRGLRSVLKSSPDIYVRNLMPVPPEFDARYSALGREYLYRVADRVCAVTSPPGAAPSGYMPVGFSPLSAAYRVPAWLDDVSMQEIAAELVGLWDFAAFCKPRPGATTVRELRRCSIFRMPEGLLHFRLEGDAFCHSMVRNLVGALVEVGRGRLTGEQIVQLRDGRRRVEPPLFSAAPAAGLCLLQVSYPGTEDLAAQTLRTKNRRRLEKAVEVDRP